MLHLKEFVLLKQQSFIVTFKRHDMQKYVDQLIESIREAGWRVRPPHELWDHADLDSELELEDMAYVEQFVYGEEIPMAEITGIDPIELPPPEKLTIKQKAMLAKELEELLRIKNFIPDFPAKLPFHLRYSHIRELWNGEYVEMSFGETHLELCNFNEDHCPFPGYCDTCEEIREQMRYDERNSGKSDQQHHGDDFELPF